MFFLKKTHLNQTTNNKTGYYCILNTDVVGIAETEN